MDLSGLQVTVDCCLGDRLGFRTCLGLIGPTALLFSGDSASPQAGDQSPSQVQSVLGILLKRGLRAQVLP